MTYNWKNFDWEHQKGMRMPRQVSIAFSFTVLHDVVPNMLTQFYGKKPKSAYHNLPDEDFEAIGVNP